MQKPNPAGRAALVLDLASGTAILHGEEIELPLREFKLLAELAKRVGKPVENSALIAAVWPEAPWTTSQDLYVLVSKLRSHIDGPDKFGSNIRNRRGFGYLLDLPAESVLVIDPDPSDVVPLVVSLDEEGSATDSAAEAPTDGLATQESDALEAVTTEQAPKPKVKPTWPRSAIAAGIALLVLGVSWSAGYVLSSRDATRSQSDSEKRQDPVGSQPKDDASDNPPQRGGGGKKANDRRRKNDSGSDAIAAPGGSADTPTTSAGSAQEGSGKGSRREEPVPPPLPPAPTRNLYHLVDTDTGDHFVTTDGNTASEYEAQGYVGGAIARIYTYKEDGTKAITTDHGTAYIFISKAAKTEPSSKVITLWYSTNNEGDFFYTTNESEAKQSGWNGSVIGYVRAL